MSLANQPVPARPSLWQKHQLFETNSIFLVLGIIVMIAFGGIVEIIPLFYLKSTIEKVDGIRPYAPLELAGFNIYVREGCYLCHSQMIRPLRDEVERYGHYSLAAESMYDHPFQWGSKRNGPDLARVGSKYSDDWHHQHMNDPRSLVPASIMPGYPFLAATPLNVDHLGESMRTLRMVGVPYTQEMIDQASKDARVQGTVDDANVDAFQKRYPGVIVRDLGADKGRLTEADALIAYLQQLGTHVDFKIYDDKANIR
jgi:cytochrome c oxidase cbb3-type subunit 2